MNKDRLQIWNARPVRGIFSLAAALIAVISLTGMMKQSAMAGGLIAQDKITSQRQQINQTNRYNQNHLINGNPPLTITKVHNPHFLINGKGVYTITITNTATISYASPIVITDIVPTNLDYSNFNGTEWNCDARVVCTYTNSGGINPHQTAPPLVIIVTATSTTVTQYVTNTVTISGTTLMDTDKTDVSADLAVAKTMHPLSSPSHKDLVFVITTTNNGPNDVTDGKLTDTLPISVTYISSTAGYNPSTGLWSFGDLAANNAAKVLTITATINKCGSLTNSIQGISSLLTDTIRTNNSASVTLKNICAELSLNKSDKNTYIIPGQTITYFIPITNVGFITATNLIITDPLDSQLSYITYSFRDQNNSLIPYNNITFTQPSSAGGIYKWQLDSPIFPSNNITLTLRAKVANPLVSGEGGSNYIANTIYMKYKEDYNKFRLKSATDSSFTPNITIIQNSVSPTEGKVNDRLTFSFLVTNHNPSVQATNVVLTDTFPSYLTYYSYSTNSSGVTAYYDSSNRIFTINLGNITPNSSKNVNIYMTINNAASSTQTLNNTGSLHFYHGPYYQYRQSNTVQYRVLGTSTLPGTGFPPFESGFSRTNLAFWFVLMISLFIIFLGLGAIGFGILRRQSVWAGWSRQMGFLIVLVGGLFLVFAYTLIQKRHPVEQTFTSASPSPNILPTSTSHESIPPFKDLVALPDYPIPTPTSIPADVNGNTPDDSPPNRILIPSLGLDTVVKYVPFDGYTWLIAGLQNEIAWMGSTSWPGLGGNTGFAGHVTLRNGADGPFRHLEDLQTNDIITVFTEQNIYTYKVSQKKVVNDDDFSIVQPSQQPILTLITCTSWNRDLGHYLQRLVVVADLVEMKPIAIHGMITP